MMRHCATPSLAHSGFPWAAPFLALAVFSGLAACDKPAAEPRPEPRATRSSAKVETAKPASQAAGLKLPEGDDGSWRKPLVGRLVALGDVHGDLTATVEALQLAGAIDDSRSWVGGKMTVVQTGDQLDRGDDEKEIIDLFELLVKQAEAAGGHFYVMNGNHETMNVAGDFRYVTQGGYQDFDSVEPGSTPEALLGRYPGSARGRAAAFLPGGNYAKVLSRRPLVLAVGDSLFAHGGVLPKHVEYGLSRINQETRDWMLGTRAKAPGPVMSDDAPVWSRHFSTPKVSAAQCKRLGVVLDALKLKRLVVGHTVQPEGVTSACNERVWRIDVGMAKHYGGKVAVLQVEGGKTEVLRASE